MAWMGYGFGRGRGNRWMFRMTGLPGWMRFGYSPGWIGVSPTGLPPGAQWMIQTGQLPNFMAYMQTQYPQSVTPYTVPNMSSVTPFDERQFLEQQMRMLQQQLEAIKKRISELEETE